MRGRLLFLLCSSCLAGCSRDVPAPGPPADLEPQAVPAPPLPAPNRGRLDAAVALDRECESCHDDEAREWRGSRHQRAYLDAAFQTAFAIEPSPFCRGCHAPESDAAREPPPAVAELGVGCVTCHVTEEGMVLAGPSESAREPPHPVRRTPELRAAGGCAGCHEFRFPTFAGGDGDERFMQTTVREHTRSPAAERGCPECHMPSQGGRRSHAFAEVRDPAWLRSRLDARAERAGDSRVRFTLAQVDPGHAFPTGDLFRRLELGCALVAPDGRELGRTTRYLARHFDMGSGFAGRRLTGDDRVFDEPAIVDVDLPGPIPRSSAIAWWVTYQRVATTGPGTDPRTAVIESEVPLRTGTIP